jgi:hypothetical protein
MEQVDIEDAIAESKAQEELKVEDVFPVEIGTLASRALLMSLKVRCWKGERVDRMVSLDVTNRANAVESAARVVKNILPKEYLSDIESIVYRARDRWRVHTWPWMDDGHRIMAVEEYQDFLVVFQSVVDQFDRAAAKIAELYPQIVEEAKTRLGQLFKEEDFPAPEEVKGLFSLDVRASPVAMSDDWRVDLDRDTVEAIRKKTEHDTVKALKGMVGEVFGRINEKVVTLVDRIDAYSSGEADKLRSELIDGLKDVAEQASRVNFGGVQAIDELVSEITSGLTVHSAKALAHDAALREDVRNRAVSISKRIKTLGEVWAQ